MEHLYDMPCIQLNVDVCQHNFDYVGRVFNNLIPQITALNSQNASLNAQIVKLNTELSTTNKSLVETNKRLEDAQKNINTSINNLREDLKKAWTKLNELLSYVKSGLKKSGEYFVRVVSYLSYPESERKLIEPPKQEDIQEIKIE